MIFFVVSYLFHHVDNNHSIEYVDFRDNALFKQSSLRLLNAINSDPFPHHVDFTMPEFIFHPFLMNRLSPDHLPSAIEDLVINKPYKDACVVFQLLYHILHLQHM